MGLGVWFNQYLHKRTRYQLVDFVIDDCVTSVGWQLTDLSPSVNPRWRANCLMVILTVFLSFFSVEKEYVNNKMP